MSDEKSVDIYTENVINRIDNDVLANLTRKQLAAFRKAICDSKPFERHVLDIRGSIPLFFARYYFVFLMGRDRRAKTEKIETERKRVSSILSGAIFFMLALSPILLVLFFALYFFKSYMGINFFQNKHLWDFLGF